MSEFENDPVLLARIFARHCQNENICLADWLAMTNQEREKFLDRFAKDVATYKPPRRSRDAS
jgi:hypothetical protein